MGGSLILESQISPSGYVRIDVPVCLRGRGFDGTYNIEKKKKKPIYDNILCLELEQSCQYKVISIEDQIETDSSLLLKGLCLN